MNGKVSGKMNKRRAEKLVAAGIVMAQLKRSNEDKQQRESMMHWLRAK